MKEKTSEELTFFSFKIFTKIKEFGKIKCLGKKVFKNFFLQGLT
jgi:hypothetical protein